MSAVDEHGEPNGPGPTEVCADFAPSESARLKAWRALTTRKAIAGADGPCACAKLDANEFGSAFRMKLMSPWR